MTPVATRVVEVARALHTGAGWIAAANVIQGFAKERPVDNDVDAVEVLRALVQWLLDSDRYDLAAQVLWSPTQFCSEPRSVQSIWSEVRSNPLTLLMGASSMGKSYTPGVLFLLEWLRDPEWTAVRCVGPTEAHLATNLFSHLTSLHQTASIPLPGVSRDLFIGLDPKRQEGGILGVIIPQGSARARGRLQGSKRRPRPKPHPVFGSLSRLLLLIDELENVAPAVYSDLENIVANIQQERDPGFRIVASWNPKDRGLKPYELAEPPLGWPRVDIDKDFVWNSRRGYRVVRLDAAQSENVLTGKVIFPGLQTKAGFDKTVMVAGGVGSPGYYTFARGMYPPTGGSKTLMTGEQLEMRLAVPIWKSPPVAAAGVDLALTGGASAPFCRGWFGEATGVKLADGRAVMFRNSAGDVISRPVIYCDAIDPLEAGPTVPMAKTVRTAADANRVAPAWLAVDRTGNGSGVHDILTAIWSSDVRGVNYSEGATDKKILAEDKDTAKKLYGRVVSELWFAVQKFVQYGFLWFSPTLAGREELFQQLTSRQFDPQRADRVESKKEYCDRGFRSPDEADSLTLMVHAVRLEADVLWSFSGAPIPGGPASSDMQLSGDVSDPEPLPPDPTNALDYLDG